MPQSYLIVWPFVGTTPRIVHSSRFVHLEMEQIVGDPRGCLHFMDSGGLYAKLKEMKADDVTLDDAENFFMPYLSDAEQVGEY